MYLADGKVAYTEPCKYSYQSVSFSTEIDFREFSRKNARTSSLFPKRQYFFSFLLVFLHPHTSGCSIIFFISVLIALADFYKESLTSQNPHQFQQSLSSPFSYVSHISHIFQASCAQTKPRTFKLPGFHTFLTLLYKRFSSVISSSPVLSNTGMSPVKHFTVCLFSCNSVVWYLLIFLQHLTFLAKALVPSLILLSHLSGMISLQSMQLYGFQVLHLHSNLHLL